MCEVSPLTLQKFKCWEAEFANGECYDGLIVVWATAMPGGKVV